MSARNIVLAAGCVAGCIVFFGFPDLDISLLGIGKHRHFLFHSAFFPLLGYLVTRPFGKGGILRKTFLAVSAVFSLSICIHLITDLFRFKAVYFPVVKNLKYGTSLDDNLWTGLNSLACLGLSIKAFREIRKKNKRESE